MPFDANQQTESGYLAIPESGSGPGILVLHAWWGLNSFFTGVCDRLAQQGFVVLAPDLYAGKIAHTIAEADTMSSALDFDHTQAQILESLTYLQNMPERVGDSVATIGFSMGSYWALRLSSLRPESVGATVLFYGVGEVDFTKTDVAYQGHFAENDPWEPLEQVRQMESKLQAAATDVAVHVYPGVGHWFFEEDRPDAYHAESAQLAWDRTMSFLRSRLQP